MTTLTASTGLTVREVLAARQCSERCLLSGSTARCRCQCGGIHHGAALAALGLLDTAPAVPNRAATRRQRRGRKAR